MKLSTRDKTILIAILAVGLLAAYWFLLLAPKRGEAGKLQTKVDARQKALQQSKTTLGTYQGARDNYQANYTAIVRLGKAVPASVDMPSLIIQLDRASRAAGIDFRRVAAQQAAAAPPAPPAATPPAGGDSKSGGDSSSTPASGSTPPAQGASSGTAGAAQSPGAVASAQGAAQGSQPAGTTPPAAAAAPPAAGAAAPAAAAPGSEVFTPVPIQFTFQGSFFDLDDFFRRIRSLVSPGKDRVAVSGRLMIVDGIDLSQGAHGFPEVQATVSATAYVTPAGQGLTGGATPMGPASSAPGAQPASGAPVAPATTTGIKP